jgi:multidrug resistance efflux pump
MKTLLIKTFRILITLGLAAAAGLAVMVLWRHYMEEPWTRDGRVRVEVVDIAPEVPGTVTAVAVADNQLVHKGDVLFQIDPVRFRLAAAQAQAEVDQHRQDLELKLADAKRRSGMTGVVSSEEIDRFKSAANVARAALEAAEASLEVAKLNLDRATLRAPITGYVTNLRLRAGDYVAAGVPRVAIIDQDSFWVAGYFEETKLGRIHVGDPARIALMSRGMALDGHVESIGRGIADSNDRPNDRGLPDVSPVFTWVRLAQRIPVRIHLDRVPDGIVLAAGMTCTIGIGPQPPSAGYGARLLFLIRQTVGNGETLE